MKTVLSFLFLFGLLVFSACDNNDDPKPKRIDILTTGKWEIITIGGQPPIQGEIYEFDEDGSFVSIRSTGNFVGTWKFENNETVLDLTYPGSNYEGTINKMTAEEMRISWNQDNGKETLYKPKL